MNLEKVIFGFFIILAMTLNFGFFVGELIIRNTICITNYMWRLW